jgi:hypothetical protein
MVILLRATEAENRSPIPDQVEDKFFGVTR